MYNVQDSIEYPRTLQEISLLEILDDKIVCGSMPLELLQSLEVCHAQAAFNLSRRKYFFSSSMCYKTMLV
jgi:hypothetical protein